MVEVVDHRLDLRVAEIVAAEPAHLARHDRRTALPDAGVVLLEAVHQLVEPFLEVVDVASQLVVAAAHSFQRRKKRADLRERSGNKGLDLQQHLLERLHVHPVPDEPLHARHDVEVVAALGHQLFRGDDGRPALQVPVLVDLKLRSRGCCNLLAGGFSELDERPRFSAFEELAACQGDQRQHQQQSHGMELQIPNRSFLCDLK